MEAKLALARFLVDRSHGPDAARAAEEHFTRVVRQGAAPDELPEVSLPGGDPVHLPALLVGSFGVASTSEARRLIAQGGVRVDGAVTSDVDVPRAALEGAVLQVGKRRFARLTVA
jgi:tyrosyl-tRNA synthetase